MKALRKVQGVFSLVASILFAIFAVIYLVAGFSLIPHTIKNGDSINREFRFAATWVDDFMKLQGHLPTHGEFSAWAEQQSTQHKWLGEMTLLTAQQKTPYEVTKVFGKIPASGYILQVWRGEWFEYFSSWKYNSTVDTPTSLWVSTVFVSFIFLLSSIVCWYLSRRFRLTI